MLFFLLLPPFLLFWLGKEMLYKKKCSCLGKGSITGNCINMDKYVCLRVEGSLGPLSTFLRLLWDLVYSNIIMLSETKLPLSFYDEYSKAEQTKHFHNFLSSDFSPYIPNFSLPLQPASALCFPSFSSLRHNISCRPHYKHTHTHPTPLSLILFSHVHTQRNTQSSE